MEHAFLDRIYYCPHHPEKGFPGERAELKILCQCRKPATGMIQRAAADLHVDLAHSWLIGDTTTDVQTARNAGLHSILVRTGAAGADGRHAVTPDRICQDLLEAVKFLLEEETAGNAAPLSHVAPDTNAPARRAEDARSGREDSKAL
jgi:histidinol phosphatase-like enzyme